MRDRFTRIALLIAIILLIGFVAEPYIARFFYAEQAPRAVTPRGDLAPIERTNVELFERAAPSVVHVFAQARARREFLFEGEEGGGQQTGTGFVWDAAGHIVTNNHVVQNASPIAIRLNSGEIVPRRARRHGAELRSRRAAPRQGSPAAARDRGRHLERPQGRAVRLCDRQSLRPRPDADHRRHQRAPAASSDGRGPGACRRDPDRRADQSRQLRRPASRTRRAGSSASIRRSSRPPAPRPASASRSRSTW